jgi:hypothetical protein
VRPIYYIGDNMMMEVKQITLNFTMSAYDKLASVAQDQKITKVDVISRALQLYYLLLSQKDNFDVTTYSIINKEDIQRE